MKKKLLSLFVMMAFAHAFCAAEEKSDIKLESRDFGYLRALFRRDACGTLTLKEIDLDYYLMVLPAHIKILENKIAQKKAGWKSKGMFYALGSTALTCLLAWTAYDAYQQFTTGQFRSVDMPDYTLKQLAATIITPSEIEKLAHCTVKNINLSPRWYYSIVDLSESDVEKIIYLAIKQARWKTQCEMVGATIFSSIWAACTGVLFHKVSRHAERLIERLERDKRILALLEDEKARFDTRF